MSTPPTQPPEDEWPDLLPLDGDPDLCRQQVDDGLVRDAVAQLREIDNPENDRQADQVGRLHLSWAARGRELDRMRSLVVGVTSGEARRGLEDEIRLLNERLAAREREIAEMGEQFTETAQEFQQERGRLEQRRQRTAARAHQAYGAWISASVRLEHQAETIRTLMAKVKEWADIAEQATQALAELRPVRDADTRELTEELVHCSRTNCVGHPAGCGEVC